MAKFEDFLTPEMLEKLRKPMQDLLPKREEEFSGGGADPLVGASDYGQPADLSGYESEPLEPAKDVQPNPVSPQMLGLQIGPNSSQAPSKEQQFLDSLKSPDLQMSGTGPVSDPNKYANLLAKYKEVTKSRNKGGSDLSESPKSSSSPVQEGFTNATVENRLLAQRLANENALMANLGKAATTMGTGIAGAISGVGPAKDVTSEQYDALLKQADAPIKTFEAATEQEKTDPNSTFSSNFRKFAKPIADAIGFAIPDSMSAEQINKVLPQLSNMYTQKEEANARRQDMQMRMMEMSERRKTQANDRQDLLTSRQFQTWKNRLPSIGGPNATSLRNRITQASNIFATLGQDRDITPDQVEAINVKDLDKAKKLQIMESAIELNKLLSGSGAPAASTLDKLILKSGASSATDAVDWLTNKQNPRQQGEYLKDILKVTARARENAQKDLGEIYKKDLAGTSRFEKNPLTSDDYKEVLREYGLSDKQLGESSKMESKTIRVSNGKEILEIDPSDLKDAEKDGYKRVE